MIFNIFNGKGSNSKGKTSAKGKGKKSQYSAAEKQAYAAGKAYAAAKAGQRVGLKTEKEKESFRNGMKSVK